MSQVDKIVRAFKIITQNSSPVSATILKLTENNASVVSTWSQRNLERKTTVQLQLTQTVNLDTNEVSNLGSVETTTEMMATFSQSGMYRGLFRETPATGKTTKKQFLEVWKENRLMKVIDLTSLEVHGDVYTDSDFGTFEWSPLEDKVLYVAERKIPKSEPYISSKSPNKKGEETTKGGEYLLVEDWGESLVGKSQPVLVVARVGAGEVEVVEGVEGGLAAGQGVWAPDGGVVAVGWDPAPRRLGLVYCTNRLSWIFHVSPQGVFRKLSKDGLAVRCPQFSPDGKTLIWLEREYGGPHHSCLRLVKYNWETGEQSIVVDIVKEEAKSESGAPFYGLFNSILKNCWLPDNKTVALSTPQDTMVKTYLVDTELNTVTELGCEEGGSQGVLCSKGDAVVCWRSSLLTSPGLYLGRGLGGPAPPSWLPLLPSKPLPFAPDYKVGVFNLKAPPDHPESPTDKNNSASVRDFSALYLGPKTGKDVPLVVWPHGGPHSCFSNAFSLMASFFASMGLAMVMVNYRGSAGRGEKGVEYLLGRVGQSDVSDVHQAATHALSTEPSLDPSKTLLFGGSHGGFLVLHLSGQHPDSYKSCAAINPVVDLPSFSGSDIPDWAVVEAGFSYSATGELTTEMFDKMKKASPLSRVDSVVAPTLLLLGKKDLRVPVHQGLAYYHALKARGIKTKALMYDDNHPLLQTMHEADFAINTAVWYFESIDHDFDWLTGDCD